MRKNIGVFRGKRKDNGEWVEGFFTCATDCCGRSYFIDVPRKDPDDSNHRYEVDPETVGEFTGLTDKNGVRIFEGDIVRTYAPDDPPAVVKYDSRETMYAIVIDNIFYGMGEHFNPGELIVIGNIHDSPELMKGDEPT